MKYLLLTLLLLGALSACSNTSVTLKHSCIIANSLPDHACTPGATLATATKERVCTPGYASSVRNVPQSEKNAVYAAYGLATHAPGSYEIDHLVSLELGGSNDMKNLWPELYTGPHNAYDKDKVENSLHAQVCAGTLTLQAAQHKIAANWMHL